MKKFFSAADVLLPKFHPERETMSRYSTVACDQFTSEPEYWEKAEKLTDGYVSTLKLVLPEIYLGRTDELIPEINAKMEEYRKNVYKVFPDSYIYIERTLPSNGGIRRGIVGKIDLEAYDYNKGSLTPIRASEGTVLSRIPPRVKIRRGASLELPHVMLFCDDEKCELIEPLSELKADFTKAYDFDLMLGSGNIKGWIVNAAGREHIDRTIEKMSGAEYSREKYGVEQPLLFAVGDGNHSLATAKACYEELKAQYGDAALTMPGRYALCEVVNIHDDSIEFEPIYRLLEGCSAEDLLKALEKSRGVSYTPTEDSFAYTLYSDAEPIKFYLKKSASALAVGEIQDFLDEFLKDSTGVSVDYIHGLDSVKALSDGENKCGIVFDGMKKSELFSSVIKDGALPRKTFSMGEAKDKRFYLEAREIV